MNPNKAPHSASNEAPLAVSFWDAFKFWLKLGFISFGGPAGQIAIMHQELVENRHWISERRFLHALNYCMVLPGPEALRRWLRRRAASSLFAGPRTGNLGAWPARYDNAPWIGLGNPGGWCLGPSLPPCPTVIKRGCSDGRHWIRICRKLHLLALARGRLRRYAQSKLGRCQSVLALGACKARRGCRR